MVEHFRDFVGGNDEREPHIRLRSVAGPSYLHLIDSIRWNHPMAMHKAQQVRMSDNRTLPFPRHRLL